MKKLLLYPIILIVLFGISAQGQSTDQFNFQGIAREASGTLMALKTVKVRFTIHEGSAAGTVKYQETQSLTTTADGLFSAQIGSGSVVSGSVSTIDWSTGLKYLEVEMDPNNGNSYLPLSNTQMTSVPFTKVSDMAGGLAPSAKIAPAKIKPSYETGTGTKYLRFNGTSWTAGLPFFSSGSLNFPLAAATSVTTPAFLITNNFYQPGMYLKGAGKAAMISATIGIGTMMSSNSTSPTLDVNNSGRGAGLHAISNTGTALNLTTASTGTAMDLNGKVVITGGNTNPADRARLTSDAAGNAVWKDMNGQGFGGSTMSITICPSLSCEVVPQYTYSKGTSNGGQQFVVPVSGVYNLHADGEVYAKDFGLYYSTPYLLESSIVVRVKRNGNLVQTFNGFHREFDPVLRLFPKLSTYAYLNAGDIVEIRLKIESVTEPAIVEDFSCGANLVFAQ